MPTDSGRGHYTASEKGFETALSGSQRAAPAWGAQRLKHDESVNKDLSEFADSFTIVTAINSILYSTKRSPLYAFIMLSAFALMLMLGLGVFRFEVDPAAWPTNTASIESMTSLEALGTVPAPLLHTRFFGTAFWLTQLVIGLMALLLPYLRPIRASLATLMTAALVLLMNFPPDPTRLGIPLEFELMTILALFSLYILLSFIGEIRDRQKLASIFSQYVPPELVEQYSRNPNSISLEGEAREITVLFCDILGFTSISEKLEPKVLASWLNRYFSTISQVVVRHGGTLDKYIGDSVMAFWGAPVISDAHADDALAAALEMQHSIAVLSRQFEAEGLPAISIGIGVSTGIGNVGNLGSRYRMAYTVVGDAVNMAQRLERQTRQYQVPIIVSGSTAERTQGMLYRELDIVRIKGCSGDIRMFQPICPQSKASDQMLHNLAEHRKAMGFFMNQDWTQAARIFKALRQYWSSDKVYDIYLKRIREHEQHPHSG